MSFSKIDSQIFFHIIFAVKSSRNNVLLPNLLYVFEHLNLYWNGPKCDIMFIARPLMSPKNWRSGK